MVLAVQAGRWADAALMLEERASVAAQVGATLEAGVLRVEADDASAVTRTLAEAGVWLSELTPLRPDLETFFLQLTDADKLGA